MTKFDYAKALETLGTSVTFPNRYFTDEKTGNYWVHLIVNNEAAWCAVEKGTHMKPLLNTTQTVILDGKTVIYPNADTHPAPEKLELPEELKAIADRIRAHKA